MKKLNELASGTVLYVADDGGYLAGHGLRFIRVVNEEIHPMAEVIAKGQTVQISVERLEGVSYDQ